jgi:ADP-heptose:LPS heptosyltransferase
LMRILIVQPRRIGDVILTTPAIDALRNKFPDARIEFLAEVAAAPVLEGYPGLDETLLFDKNLFRWIPEIRRRRYDWVLDFMCNPRTAQLTALSGATVRAGFDVPVWGRVYNRRVPRGGARPLRRRLQTAIVGRPRRSPGPSPAPVDPLGRARRRRALLVGQRGSGALGSAGGPSAHAPPSGAPVAA